MQYNKNMLLVSVALLWPLLAIGLAERSLPVLESVADAKVIPGHGGLGKWRQGVAKNDEGSLPYQLYVPQEMGEADLPLVIFLHGSGEAGVDNRLQMYADRNVGPTFFASNPVQRRFPAYVLAPQTPKKIRWASKDLHEYDFATTPMTVSMQLLFRLIDETLELHHIDAQRVYIGGLSRGGQGTWNALLHRPRLFAAGFPMAGGGSPDYADRLSHLAIWAFHGTADRITPYDYNRRMFLATARLSNHTERFRFSSYEKGDHSSAWIEGHQEADFPDWIFQWRNPNAQKNRPRDAVTHSALED